MDADATYPVPAIKEMVALLDDNDLVRGVRQSGPESMSLVNRLGNWLFNSLLAISHGLDGADHLTGLYAMRRSVALRLGTEARGFDIETEIGIRAKALRLNQAEIAIPYLPRVGEKKLRPYADGMRIFGRMVVLLLIYNPTVTFIAPGILVMAVSLTGAIVLSDGPVVTSYLGLSIHSFIVAALGVLAGFQLIVFGVAAALYGVEAGKPAPGWLLRIVSVRFRFGMGVFGLLLMLGSLAELVHLTIQWAGNDSSRIRARSCCRRAFSSLGCRRSPPPSSSRSSAGASAGSARRAAPTGLGSRRQLQRRRRARRLSRVARAELEARHRGDPRRRQRFHGRQRSDRGAVRSRARRGPAAPFRDEPGIRRGVNAALGDVRGDYVAVLNMDSTSATPGWTLSWRSWRKGPKPASPAR